MVPNGNTLRVYPTDGAKFAMADLSNFYLMTPLKQPEYGRVKQTDIPDEIFDEYKLCEKATPDGWYIIKSCGAFMAYLNQTQTATMSSKSAWTRKATSKAL